MSAPDPFIGKWTFIAAKSKMNAPVVQHWLQRTEVNRGVIRVREDIAAAGRHAEVSLEAKFDGKDYPVTGSSLADAIAYQRIDAHNIAGTGKKNGIIT